MTDVPRIGVTMGDPAGIGAEVIVKALPEIRSMGEILVIGDADVMREAAVVCDQDVKIRGVDNLGAATFESDGVDVLDLNNVDDLTYGNIDRSYGQASLEYIERAIDLVTEGRIDAITTAPIHKKSIRLAGSTYAGHTGLLAARTDTDTYSMMLIEGDFRVSHVSTHVPLREACELVSEQRVLETIRVTQKGLADLGITNPTIGVAGLNPHAGDEGVLGDEDADKIGPAVAQACEEGIDVIGPEPPDTVYVDAVRGKYDCVVSMYHDQGHIPIKLAGFRGDGSVGGVNVTVGLPIVRTSVDHGTAFDIAGEGIASEQSMIDAIEVATQIVENRR